MGYRINKLLGFGLDDVKSKDQMIDDERFNDDWYENNRFNVKEFYDWWVENSEGDSNFYAKLAKVNLERGDIREKDMFWSFVHYDGETGLDNVIAFVMPSSYHDWFRHDNDLDYNEVVGDGNEGMDAKVKMLDHPVWPWSAYWNTATTPPTKLIELQYSIYNNYLNADSKSLKSYWIRELKKDGIEVCNVAPMTPYEIIAMVKYLKIFKEEKDVYSLKPMIYTYWS
jgi:hypothetical protein